MTAIEGRENGLQRGADGIPVERRAGNPGPVDIELHVGGRLGIGPLANRMLGVVDDTDALAAVARPCVDKGGDCTLTLTAKPALGAILLNVDLDDVTPEVVYVGYTPGYMWSYPYMGVPVYGTGWRYRPVMGPYYYPRPPTWGFHVGYNPWTGWNFGMSWSNGWRLSRDG